MNLFVRGNIMTWVIVCLIAGVTAELAGPSAGGVYLIALGVGAIAFAKIVKFRSPDVI
jgi:hypothetical protein